VGNARFLIVTATNDIYLPLALDLLCSLRRLKLSIAFDIGILDLGLSDDSKALLAPFGVTLKPAGIDIDYPGREAWEQIAPFYRAMTSRPFIRDYFPGYDSYMWMDADTWAQTGDAVETMLQGAAGDDALYVAAEIDRDYFPYFKSAQPWEYHLKWYKAHFPDEIVTAFFPRPMLNSGVMALSPNAPIWKLWADTFATCLRRLPQLGRENFMSEQLSLNVALYLGELPFKIMPAEYNWLSIYCLPMLDETTGLYVRPTVPRTPLSILHLTHEKKLRLLDLPTTAGTTVQRQLTFSASASAT
jgi:hypothetical protein